MYTFLYVGFIIILDIKMYISKNLLLLIRFCTLQNHVTSNKIVYTLYATKT